MGFNLHMSFEVFVFAPLQSLGSLLGLIYSCILVPSFLKSQLTFLDALSFTCQGHEGLGLLVLWGLQRICRSTWGFSHKGSARRQAFH